MDNANLKKIYDLKVSLLNLYEKNGSVKNVNEAYAQCHNALVREGFKLINTQNTLLIDNMEVKIYTKKIAKDDVFFYVIYLPLTNSLIFPISLETNCPQELKTLAQNILDKTGLTK